MKRTSAPSPAQDRQPRRREFLGTSLSAASGLVIAGCVAADQAGGTRPRAPATPNLPRKAEVAPGADLMQEHGVLERIVLLYEEAARRIELAQSVELPVVAAAAGIVRRVIEDHHQRLEERYLFPPLEAARREVELVAVLRHQHLRGRRLTDDIARLSEQSAGPELEHALWSFSRMVRPHTAREESVLLPAFREIIGGAAFRELGEVFEEEDHTRFGDGDFRAVVAEVARLESSLGIANLASATPS